MPSKRARLARFSEVFRRSYKARHDAEVSLFFLQKRAQKQRSFCPSLVPASPCGPPSGFTDIQPRSHPQPLLSASQRRDQARSLVDRRRVVVNKQNPKTGVDDGAQDGGSITKVYRSGVSSDFPDSLNQLLGVSLNSPLN